MPASRPEFEEVSKNMIEVGAKVVLKVCPYGRPGTVVRIERSRVVVLWHDLDYLARHQPASLTVAAESPEKPPAIFAGCGAIYMKTKMINTCALLLTPQNCGPKTRKA